MKTKIKLQHHELQAFFYALKQMSSSLPIGELDEFLIALEIKKLSQSVLNKLIYGVNKKAFTLVLTNFQTVALFKTLSIYADYFQPLEYSIALRIIEDINQQFINYKQLLYNFQEKNSLLIK